MLLELFKNCQNLLCTAAYRCVQLQLITELPFTGTGDTLEYANDYHITTCTGASSVADTVGSPVNLPS